MTAASIILASASPRRRELLDQIGIPCTVMPVDIDESLLPGETPEEHVQRLAVEKAAACVDRLGADAESVPVLGADTIVVLEGEVMGKPDDEAHARAMLTRLSGREHCVITAVCVMLGRLQKTALCSSYVLFDDLDVDTVTAYAATGEPLGKAGGYAIQGRASMFIKRLQGSYSGVVGLPLNETATLLRAFGFKTL